jgi:hypothetical protein
VIGGGGGGFAWGQVVEMPGNAWHAMAWHWARVVPPSTKREL